MLGKGDPIQKPNQYMESQTVKLKIEKVKTIARDVYRSLGSGFSEDVYDKAMQVGLRLAGINYESQKVIELKYKDHHVGEGYPDLVVRLGREKLIIELKAVGSEMGSAEEQQLRNYMRILKINHGLLINFQQPGRRKTRTALEFKEVRL
jgi:GxxExxY protein